VTGLTAVLALMPVAYLLGTFPAAKLAARGAGRDVTREGSGNPGASNVIRLVGWRAGLLVLLADIGKGAIPSAAGLLLDGHRGAYLLGAAAFLGHVFPVTRRLKGGKGVATAAGVLLVLFPLIGLGLAALWFVVARGLKKASVASVLASVAFPVLVGLTGGSWGDVIVTGALALAIVVRHVPNLVRLVRGQELDLGEGASAGTVPPR